MPTTNRFNDLDFEDNDLPEDSNAPDDPFEIQLSNVKLKRKIQYLQTKVRLQLHGAIYRPDSFVLMLGYCVNLKAIRYESTSLNRIVADKSHRVIVASEVLIHQLNITLIISDNLLVLQNNLRKNKIILAAQQEHQLMKNQEYLPRKITKTTNVLTANLEVII